LMITLSVQSLHCENKELDINNQDKTYLQSVGSYLVPGHKVAGKMDVDEVCWPIFGSQFFVVQSKNFLLFSTRRHLQEPVLEYCAKTLYEEIRVSQDWTKIAVVFSFLTIFDRGDWFECCNGNWLWSGPNLSF
jgi:hypothetical protein